MHADMRTVWRTHILEHILYFSHQVEGRKRVVKHLVLQGHADSIMFLAWSHDDRLLATCGMDHLVKIGTRPRARAFARSTTTATA